jgi:hypothetical protein
LATREENGSDTKERDREMGSCKQRLSQLSRELIGLVVQHTTSFLWQIKEKKRKWNKYQRERQRKRNTVYINKDR